jgi:hypothetical protein
MRTQSTSILLQTVQKVTAAVTLMKMVGLEILTVVAMQITFLEDVKPCSLVHVSNVSEKPTAPPRLDGRKVNFLFFYPEDGESTFLRSFGKYIPNYTH